MDEQLNNKAVMPDLRKWTHWCAFGFGTGLADKAPGTWGTLPGIPLFLLLSGVSLPAYIFICVVLFVFGVWLCDVVSRDLRVHDHGGIVWDEIVGFLITMIAVPVSFWSVILGFALFRLFDIAKPWPIKALDKNVDGGFGIMIDDVLAGVFANISLQLLLLFIY